MLYRKTNNDACAREKCMDGDIQIQFHSAIRVLKDLYRQGWIKYHGVPKERAESVADHSYGVAMLALMMAVETRPELDAGRVALLALVHDFGEVGTIGDVTPHDGVSTKDK